MKEDTCHPKSVFSFSSNNSTLYKSKNLQYVQGDESVGHANKINKVTVLVPALKPDPLCLSV